VRGLFWEEMKSSEATSTGLTMARIAGYRVGLIGLVVLELVAWTAAARTSERSWVLEKGQGALQPSRTAQ
jgi:hypothetical protein